MKSFINILIGVGLFLLIVAGVTKLIGKPQTFIGVRVISLIVLSNALFSLAILAKLFQKK